MESILDTDLYKFSMQQAVRRYYPDARVTYKFYDRSATRIENPDKFIADLFSEIWKIEQLRLMPYERRYLEGLGFFENSYLEWLTNFRFNAKYVYPVVDQNGHLQITIRDTWANSILWEVPLLAAVTKVYLKGVPADITKHYHKLMERKQQLGNLKFCEFGTRRRRNFDYQALAIQVLKNAPGFSGTSNVHLARQYDIPVVGTMAHEWIMGVSAETGVEIANGAALTRWVNLYQGKLGVALTDTFGSEAFFREFNGILARIYDGIRQDSGDPVAFAHRATNHYVDLGINPAHKRVLFSDGLNGVKCQKIDAELDTPIQRMYCIGTDFTNDQKLNLVIKLDTVNDKPVVKLSDEPGKATGDPKAVASAKRTLELED